MLLVLTTAPSLEEAETLGDKIVRSRLAACVQILPRMTSIYAWEGEIRKEGEYLLLIKTIESLFQEVEAFIRSNHNYETPEITAFSSEGVSRDYLKWLTDYVNPTPDS